MAAYTKLFFFTRRPKCGVAKIFLVTLLPDHVVSRTHLSPNHAVSPYWIALLTPPPPTLRYVQGLLSRTLHKNNQTPTPVEVPVSNPISGVMNSDGVRNQEVIY
jgi:hypothetical protein